MHFSFPVLLLNLIYFHLCAWWCSMAEPCSHPGKQGRATLHCPWLKQHLMSYNDVFHSHSWTLASWPRHEQKHHWRHKAADLGRNNSEFLNFSQVIVRRFLCNGAMRCWMCRSCTGVCGRTSPGQFKLLMLYRTLGVNSSERSFLPSPDVLLGLSPVCLPSKFEKLHMCSKLRVFDKF